MEFIKILADDASLDVFAPVLSNSAISSVINKEKTIGFGCTIDEKPIAACLSVIKDRKAEIISLFVPPEYRRSGIGKELLSMLYWEVFYSSDAAYIGASYSLLSAENTEALNALFRSCGYRFDLHHSEYKLFEFGAKDLAPIANIPSLASPFSSLGKLYIKDISDKLFEMSFIETPSLPESTDFDFSMAIFENRSLSSFVWVEKLKDDIYRLAAVYNSSENSNSLKPLIGQLISVAKEKLSPEDLIIADVYDSASAKLVDRLTSGKARPSQRFMEAVLII